MRVVRVLALGTTLVVACVAPARTAQDYRADAAETAKQVAAVLASVVLTIEVAQGEAATAPYLSLRLSESEAAASAAVATFRELQPPTPGSDRLRETLLERLDTAVEGIEETRILVRRRAFDQLPPLEGDLRALVAELRGIEAELRG
ncbi:MAG TPA: hypothetical protein VM638_05465 [Actinomycetota bacterium]|nr:hypothetical protein [Actinomycetota bacterium]